MATMAEALDQADDPNVRHVVSISGGKDSAALAVYIAQNFPELPAEYVFCDTGCELPETYEFLERMEALLGVEVKRLNVLDALGIQKKPNRTPFDVLLEEYYGGFLPNQKARWCTRMLKIRPFEQYIGDDFAYSYIGIRGDENRQGYVAKKPPKISDEPNIVPVYPFKDAGFGLSDIKSLLEDVGLGLPDYYQWRSRSGCYFCFYQQKGEWAGLKQNHPDLFEAAKRYEKVENGKRYTWRSGESLLELERANPVPATPNIDDDDGCAVCHL